ncbi:GNAT family N-acetyltransferase [Oscillatoria sp. CS-180]|uniref:GNAT family N-acetyltransferase n=1 Tax=Oscillatoria sp. CS-180 TaxID=3021720 RepID=UPI00232E9DE4|nr:GNAT family N-acetyltransferase [Oscillatoria sp. CS-180]MDB9528569.1 GNAT family N-acetyltransferase [Oscillatoria sp. CS-180]
MSFEIPGYQLRRGSRLDRALLLKFLSQTYEETAGTRTFFHLEQQVERHFSNQTPLWWVDPEQETLSPIACLWLGNAVDQQQGDRHSYVLMLYVAPEHRRQGIATALMHHAQDWANARGDHQIGLQVFANNPGAIALYRKLGYHTHSLWLTKPLTKT